MELFLLRGTSFVESVADGFVQDCSSVGRIPREGISAGFSAPGQ